MSETAAVEARIAHILSAYHHVENLSIEVDLFETGTIDSLGFVELLLRLEQEFGVRVSVEELDLDHFRTIQRIAEFVIAQNGKTPTVPRSERKTA